MSIAGNPRPSQILMPRYVVIVHISDVTIISEDSVAMQTLVVVNKPHYRWCLNAS